MIRILCFLLLGGLLSNCKTNQAVAIQEVEAETSSKIIFLTYKYDKAKFVLSNKVVAEGKLKSKASNVLNAKNGDITFKQEDKNGNVLHSEIISNPFTKTVEYADENGVFQKKVVDIANPEITIRTELFAGAAFLILEEYNTEKSEVKLLTKTEL